MYLFLCSLAGAVGYSMLCCRCKSYKHATDRAILYQQFSLCSGLSGVVRYERVILLLNLGKIVSVGFFVFIFRQAYFPF